jgi:hypothetical protein
MITPTTVETAHARPQGAGQLPGMDGYYETWLSHGRAVPLGFADNRKNALVIRADLDLVAREMAG